MFSEAWLYAFVSVFIVSVVSFVGILTICIKEEKLEKLLLYFVAFSAGGLLGGAFFHLLPEAVEKFGFEVSVSFFILLGIVVFFVLEKMIHWRHCHIPTSDKHPHPFAYTNLLGDSIHNFIDGLIIGASYLTNISLGIIATFAVILHEIPQEIGDFGVLVYGGFSRRFALFINFLTALTAFLGLICAFASYSVIENFTFFLVPFAAGGFIYVASTDLMPELHKSCFETKKSFAQLLMLIFGMVIIFLIKFIIPE